MGCSAKVILMKDGMIWLAFAIYALVIAVAFAVLSTNTIL
jgi:hypothetical protein